MRGSAFWRAFALCSILAWVTVSISGCTPDVDGGSGSIDEEDVGTPPGGGMPPPGGGTTVSTDFSDDGPSPFKVGDDPLSADFDGGAKSGGAWVLPAGTSGIVQFNTPASAVNFNFQDGIAAAALGKTGRFARKAACGIDSTGNDPTEAYGTEIYLRGSFDGFMDPPADGTQFENLGSNVYEIELQLDAQALEFKIAAADWSIQWGNVAVTLDTPVTLLDADGFGTNATITLDEAGCYNFSLDTTLATAPVLTVTTVTLDAGTCGVGPTGNDPTEAYGTAIYLRGSFDGFMDPPADGTQFENLGSNVYEVELELDAQALEFKVAAADWSIQWGNVAVTLDTPVTLLDADGFGTNATITLAEAGCYNFSLDTTTTTAPVLTITKVETGGGECGIAPSEGDPSEAYGTPVYLRGSFDGFMDPPADGTMFENLGGNTYEVELELDAQALEFKVAAADWSVQWGNVPVTLDTPVTLLDADGFGTNATITLEAAACYNFSLDTTTTSAPVLTVTLKGSTAPPATPSEVRIYDVDDNLIDTIPGGPDVDVDIEREDGESLIDRIEYDNSDGTQRSGMTEMSFVASEDDTPPTTFTANYMRPDGEYGDVMITFTGDGIDGGSQTVMCAAVSNDANFGCNASVEAAFGSEVSYTVTAGGVEDEGAAGSGTATSVGGEQRLFGFSDDNLLQVPSPEWPEQIIYFLMTDRYNNADESNDCIDGDECRPDENAGYSGGDFQGIIEELDYIKDMGFTAIWITPPVAGQWWDPLVDFGGYHGYWARNMKQVDEHYGSLNDYKLLSDTLHRNDMYLFQDVVVNHFGNFYTYPGGTFNPDDPAENCSRNPNTVPVTEPTQEPFDQNNCLDPAESSQDIYHWRPQILDFNNRTQELTWQLSDLDDMATENPVVREELKDTFGYWIREVGVDGFRIDTVKFVENEFYEDWVHSTDVDNPGIDRSAELVGKNDFLEFGEVFNTSAPFDTSGEEKIADYQGTVGNPQVQSMIQFPLYQENLNVLANGQPTSQMRFRLEAFMDPQYFRDPFITPTFLDNHDVARWLTAGNVESLEQGLMFLMTLPGIPIVYMGTAQEFTVTRQAMFAGGFSSQDRDWFDKGTPLYGLISELTALRKGRRVLTRGDLSVLSENAQSVGGLTYLREYDVDDTAALVMMNTADEPILISGVTGLPAGTELTLVKSLRVGAPDSLAVPAQNGLALELPARGMALYEVGDVGTPPGAGVIIGMDNPPNGATFDAPFTLTGTATGDVDALQLELVIDELSGRSTPVTMGTPAGASVNWSVEVPLGDLALNDRFHKLVVWDPDSTATSITDTFKSTFVPPSVVVGVDDPAGDDTGPFGTYTYPTDPSFVDTDGDILRVESRSAGRNMDLTLTMASVQNSFGSPTFDHVSFNIFFDLPDQEGISVLPEIDAEAPGGFLWDFQHRVYGFGQGLHSKENADADFRGEPVSGSPATVVDRNAGLITFQYDADDFGRSNWEGVKIYVTAWDIDGLEDVHRPLTDVAEPFTFGGRQNPDDDLILDDAAILEIPQ